MLILELGVICYFIVFPENALGDRPKNSWIEPLSKTHWIAFIFLNEHLHWLDMLAIPLTIVGIVFFAQPSFLGFSETKYDSEAYLGMCFAILSSFLTASCYTIIRKIGKRAHYTVTVFYYSSIGMLVLGTIIAFTTGFTLPCQVCKYKGGNNYNSF